MDKVIVISIDAMISDDIKEFEKLSNASKLLSGKKAIAEKIHCIYPTYTYPCHTTIMTGCYPDKHGIYHNDVFNPYSDKDEWFWYSSAIKMPTMIDAARRAGLTTASISWPVMGSSPADYLIAEIWADKETDDPSPVFDKADSPSVKHIFEKNKHLLNWMKTPGLDLFASSSASDIIREFRPDLTFVHFSYLDHQRHNNGAETAKNINAIKFIDERLGEIIKAAEDAGIAEDTTFILLGDHGHINVDRIFNINRVLADKGYITLDESGKVKDWKLFVHSASFSGHVYSNGISEDDAIKIFEDIQKEYPGCIERIMTPFETEELYHLSGPFSLLLEAENNVIFGKDITGEIEAEPDNRCYKFSESTHGFAPEKGPNPPFIVAGKRAKECAFIKHARLVDEAPTIMSIFGIRLDGIDGRSLDLIEER